jgi:hypothetical protein
MTPFSAGVIPLAPRGRPADDQQAPEVLELLLGASPLPAREVLELGSGGGSFER